jgi:hypothetical protein
MGSRRTRLRPAGTKHGRYLHLVDIENLLGGWVTPTGVPCFIQAYRGLYPWHSGHMFTAAVSKRFADSVFELPRSWRVLLAGNHPDAADEALLTYTSVQYVTARFDGLVIASGDHIFAEFVSGVRAAGIATTILTGHGHVSASLYCAAHNHVSLSDRARSTREKAVA